MPRRVCFLTRTLTPTRPQTGELQVLTKAEALKHRNASLGKVKMTRVQKLAQEWVESIFTELLIMVLLVMDLSKLKFGEEPPKGISPALPCLTVCCSCHSTDNIPAL